LAKKEAASAAPAMSGYIVPKKRAAPLKESFGIFKKLSRCCPTSARAERKNFGI